MDVGLIQSIQMAGDGIVVEPGRLEPWTDQFLHIDVMCPSSHMNERLTTTQDIQEQQSHHIADSSLALGIHWNESVDQRRKDKILEEGAYYK